MIYDAVAGGNQSFTRLKYTGRNMGERRMPSTEKDFEDWEHILWFFAGHLLKVHDAHVKGTVELESEIQAFNEELYYLIRDYTAATKLKMALPKDAPQDKKTAIIIREHYRLYDKLKEYINAMD